MPVFNTTFLVIPLFCIEITLKHWVFVGHSIPENGIDFLCLGNGDADVKQIIDGEIIMKGQNS